MQKQIQDLNEIHAARVHEKPVLGYILVGNKPESQLYVDIKMKSCEEVGIDHRGVRLPEDASEQQIIKEVTSLQEDPCISGILVQLPLPKHLNEEKILNLISPSKDVDGLHPFNVGSLAMKKHDPYFVSCTPLGCLELILRNLPAGESLEGKLITVIGRSNIVGLPMSLLLEKHNAQVTTCHSKTPRDYLIKSVGEADIVVAACGIPEFVQPDWLKNGSMVIDVGITKVYD